jgi:hypothetical protein
MAQNRQQQIAAVAKPPKYSTREDAENAKAAYEAGIAEGANSVSVADESSGSSGNIDWKKWGLWGGVALAVGVVGYIIIKKFR